ncbi:MAG: glycerophosphodiester phosphodiesterase family protein [archaeon]|nr:glycerophosphodiester phosphodiesterase family protein [archaeon]MDA0842388.1 glycerophosphodiester phosphodiesterase family protein [archaeon]MDA1168112.1 glycerophosphodiester phosphodiesterase family protein [archaeon]
MADGYIEAETMGFIQHPENTLSSLRHGMEFFDGIELDVRLTHDGGLILHHDRTLMASSKHQKKGVRFVEEYDLEELTSIGFTSFQQFISDPSIKQQWKHENKMVCIEIKRPHPSSQLGGGYFGRENHIEHISKCIQEIDQLLFEHDIPHGSVMYYSFHKHMKKSVDRSSTPHHWASLIPYIVPFGQRRFQRAKAFPAFIGTSFSSLVKKHQSQGASILPCAMEYLKPSTNWMPIGKRVGLQGKQLQSLHRFRKGMPMYVWPVKTHVEHSVLSAGLSALTDVADPNLTWLPSGHARWTNPGTQPLSRQDKEQLDAISFEHHLDFLSDLKQRTPAWKDIDRSKKVQFLDEWASRWEISKKDLENAKQHIDEHLPLFVPRLIGHRGSGKTGSIVID